ncbi:MAG: class I SAM-dependent methyltransferase [Anaerolineae bacterium]|nr:class I SAM-dependent methyltransferase [Anaerolineae bacterium]
MVTYEIQSAIESIEKNSALYDEINFDSRVNAIDDLEFNIIDRIEGLLATTHQPEDLVVLKRNAERVQRQLEAINDHLFQRLRADIRAGLCAGPLLKSVLDKYAGGDTNGSSDSPEIGYDSLDVLINGLLLSPAVITETKAREPEMIPYQQTPARMMLELVEKAPLTEQAVFYDIGSGLGQVPTLVHLLTGATAKGIEFEPAYCDYARACAADLNLSAIEFINADARTVDYSDGTVFFMYTPFVGSLLQTVLEKLQRETHSKVVWVCTYGPCTPTVAQQSWLEGVDQSEAGLYQLGVFKRAG